MTNQKDNNLAVGIFAGILPICIILYIQFSHALLYSEFAVVKICVAIILIVFSISLFISAPRYIKLLKK